MTPERYRQIGELYHAALGFDADKRAAFLERECAGDVELRREVESLLQSHEQAPDFIAAPALAVAAELLAKGEDNALIGRTIARYQVLSLIGVGGMGRVYLAEDTSLGRRVALKLLPEHLTHDRNQVQRFHREARAASALNHPNILTVHEVGQVDGTEFIATEYVEGETLRECLKRAPFGVREALEVATQVGAALVAAHAAGIVHRDIKPENIMLRGDGYVKVLDFGIAKLTENLSPPRTHESEAATRALVTNPGTVMGTPEYMSPEQARGLRVDARADVWSLGVVLYEMITLQRPFLGPTPGDIVVSILEREPPPLRRYVSDSPEELERIVTKALAKAIDERYQTVKDMTIDLSRLRRRLEVQVVALGLEEPQQEVKQLSGGPSADRQATLVGPTKTAGLARSTSSAEYVVNEIKRHRKIAVFLFAVLLLGITIAGVSVFKSLRIAQPNAGISLQAAKFNRLTNSGKATVAAISPDGKYVAHVVNDLSKQSLWIRQVATASNVQLVPPTEADFVGITFSTDGDYVVYTVRERESANGTLYRVPSLGGESRKLLAMVESRVTFSPDGQKLAFFRYVGNEDQLMIANADGSGEQKLAGRRGNEQFFRYLGAPSWSPDGKNIASPVGDLAEYYMSVVVVQVDNGAIRFFTPRKWNHVGNVAWLADGSHILISAIDQSFSSFQIWQVAYPSGEAKKLTSDLNSYSVISLNTKSDVLLTVQTEGISNLWVMPATDSTQASQITAGHNFNAMPVWTVDGKIVYAGINGHGGVDLYRIPAAGGSSTQLTVGSGDSYGPTTSADGRYIFYTYENGDAPHIWRMNVDGSGQKQLTDKHDARPFVSRDGLWVFFQNFANKSTIWKVPFDGGVALQVSDRHVTELAVSPDGTRLACWSNDESAAAPKLTILTSDKGEVVKVFDLQMPLGRQRSTIRWAADGRAINFISTKNGISNIWSQPVDGSPPVQLTKFSSDQILYFDYSYDGKQLALARGGWSNDVVLISGLKGH